MIDPQNIDKLITQARRLTRRAYLLILWERFAPAYALFVAVWVVFLIASFAGAWERIGDPWRLIALISAIVITFRVIWKNRHLRWPTKSEARRRVENDNDTFHRPLDTIHDAPALGHAGWSAHLHQTQQALENLRPPTLRPTLAKRDPYYLRFLLPVFLLLSIMLGTTASLERLRQSLSLNWLSSTNPANVNFEAWIDPPDYTGQPPIYFQGQDHINAPKGSELVMRITDAKDPVRPRLISGTKRRYLSLKALGPDSYEARTIIDADSTAQWRIGNRRQNWNMIAITDQPPEVMLNELPKADKRDRLAFNYTIKDDYGVEELTLVMRLLVDNTEKMPPDENINIILSGRTKKSEFTDAALDLSKHVWAGKKVRAYLEAKDGLEQTSKSEDAYFTVPDKIFVEPLAKAIIEQRALVLEGQAPYGPPVRKTRKQWEKSPIFDTFEPEFRLKRAPASIQRSALLLDAITDKPAGLYEDPAVFMGLKNVLYRLRYAKTQIDLEGLPEELWLIALRAEFGLLGSALEEMREAEAALRDAMARRAPQREIDALFERYNEAVDRYRKELIKKAIEEGSASEENGGGQGPGINMDEIQELLDAIEEANRIGDTEGARRALAKLSELLENMEIQLQKGGGGEGLEGEMSEEMQEALEELADLLGDQRELKDDTQQAEKQSKSSSNNSKNSQSGQSEEEGQSPENEPGDGALENGKKDKNSGNGQQGEEPLLSPQELARQQQALEELLGQMAENIPEALGSGGNNDEQQAQTGKGEKENSAPALSLEDALEAARRAMEQSEDALQDQSLGEAVDSQQRAIDALRKVGEILAAEARASGQQNGKTGDEAENNDPLGRNDTGTNDTDSEADLEQKDNATRSRELLEELRKRAAEQDRNQDERDYIERLLNQF